MTATIAPLEGGSVTSPLGFTAAAAHAGLKAGGVSDVALLVSATSCATAGLFTRNAVRAAPVLYDSDLLSERPGRIRAVAMNARVANACTGAQGLAAARAMAQAAEQAAGLPPRTALVLTTGVIGVPLPVDQIAAGLRAAAARLSADGGPDVARAIMTTDTRPKHSAVRTDTPAGAIPACGNATGRGTTKLVEIHGTGAPTETAAGEGGRAIARSGLVKGGVYGADPNWGGILAAAGAAGVGINPDKLSLAAAADGEAGGGREEAGG